jgi:hypothetical protein
MARAGGVAGQMVRTSFLEAIPMQWIRIAPWLRLRFHFLAGKQLGNSFRPAGCGEITIYHWRFLGFAVLGLDMSGPSPKTKHHFLVSFWPPSARFANPFLDPAAASKSSMSMMWLNLTGLSLRSLGLHRPAPLAFKRHCFRMNYDADEEEDDDEDYED